MKKIAIICSLFLLTFAFAEGPIRGAAYFDLDGAGFSAAQLYAGAWMVILGGALSTGDNGRTSIGAVALTNAKGKPLAKGTNVVWGGGLNLTNGKSGSSDYSQSSIMALIGIRHQIAAAVSLFFLMAPVEMYSYKYGSSTATSSIYLFQSLVLGLIFSFM